MTTDDFTTSARAEAERLTPEGTSVPVLRTERDNLVHMAEWARDHLAEQEAEGGALSDRIASLIQDLTDPGDCWFDHHGGCQEHGYLDLTPDQECPHSEAKRLLAARAVGRDAR